MMRMRVVKKTLEVMMAMRSSNCKIIKPQTTCPLRGTTNHLRSFFRRVTVKLSSRFARMANRMIAQASVIATLHI
jgi:hypothetical protein